MARCSKSEGSNIEQGSLFACAKCFTQLMHTQTDMVDSFIIRDMISYHERLRQQSIISLK